MNGNEPDHIIGHSSSMFIRPTVLVILLLFVLYGIYAVLDANISTPYLLWIFVALGLMLLIKYTIDFLDFYLDCLVLSPSGITLFMREWIFEYKTDYFQRDTIETVMHTQDSFWDKVFGKWDISITINHAITFSFDNVPDPRKKARLIQQTKEKHGIGMQYEEEGQDKSHADYGVLMEALGEVVQEYVEKNKKKSNDEDWYEDELY